MVTDLSRQKKKGFVFIENVSHLMFKAAAANKKDERINK